LKTRSVSQDATLKILPTLSQVFEVEDDAQPEPAPEIAVPPTGDGAAEDPV
jgi:hypothetical protein